MVVKVASISIEGFKSFRERTVGLEDYSILMGPNGSGKSNFLSAFSLVQAVASGNLQQFVAESGIPSLMHEGKESTDCITIALGSDDGSYGFTLEPTDDGRMVFALECLTVGDGIQDLGGGHFESKAVGHRDFPFPHADSWRVYDFDVSRDAPARGLCRVSDNAFLRPDGGNLASILLKIKKEHPSAYSRIIGRVKYVCPSFGDFVLKPDATGKVALWWRRKGTKALLDPGSLSDGTLRFACLATLLLQPADTLPEIILMDNPEWGLSPHGIAFLSEMIDEAGRTRQVILSTQSGQLVNEFSVEDIIVAEDEGGETVFKCFDV